MYFMYKHLTMAENRALILLRKFYRENLRPAPNRDISSSVKLFSPFRVLSVSNNPDPPRRLTPINKTFHSQLHLFFPLLPPLSLLLLLPLLLVFCNLYSI